MFSSNGTVATNSSATSKKRPVTLLNLLNSSWPSRTSRTILATTLKRKTPCSLFRIFINAYASVNEVGSSHTTTMMSCEAFEKLNTMSEIPAAVSTISTSICERSSLKARIRPACCVGDNSAIDCVPDVAGAIFIPCGPVTNTSSSVHSPESTWDKFFSTRKPNITSTLARPRSASRTITRLPCFAMAIAVFNVMFVLPTPPLPPVTAITLINRDCFIFLKLLAWSSIILLMLF